MPPKRLRVMYPVFQATEHSKAQAKALRVREGLGWEVVGGEMTNDELSAILSKHLPSTKWNLHRLIYEISNGCGWEERLDVSTLKARMRELAGAMPGILAEIEGLDDDPMTKNSKKERDNNAWGDTFK